MMKMPMNYQVLHIDPQPLMQEALKQILPQGLMYAEIFSVSDLSSARKVLEKQAIQLIITEVELSDGCSLEFIYRRQAMSPKVLVYSSLPYEKYSQAAEQAGADGYVSKLESTAFLLHSVRQICLGFTVFKQSCGEKTQSKSRSLSHRENTVLNYLMKGHTNKQISQILSLSEKTISTYKKRIFTKYQVNNVIELKSHQDHVANMNKKYSPLF
ncbi:response regulator transcription factor [Photobacterium sp. GJ3]|uniref:response regulator transcription factor n=1 Tax=Photobacterium sp. GJ3 TaxID=2829502 RepID=UPI001B8BC09E|nr:response regulator transcription factor [Photobacterium sp. GJ3]QUJ68874.1 response regulator transcription factor [Photobacterium sp. GJ3]